MERSFSSIRVFREQSYRWTCQLETCERLQYSVEALVSEIDGQVQPTISDFDDIDNHSLLLDNLHGGTFYPVRRDRCVEKIKSWLR